MFRQSGQIAGYPGVGAGQEGMRLLSGDSSPFNGTFPAMSERQKTDGKETGQEEGTKEIRPEVGSLVSLWASHGCGPGLKRELNRAEKAESQAWPPLPPLWRETRELGWVERLTGAHLHSLPLSSSGVMWPSLAAAAPIGEGGVHLSRSLSLGLQA